MWHILNHYNINTELMKLKPFLKDGITNRPGLNYNMHRNYLLGRCGHVADHSAAIAGAREFNFDFWE